MRTRNKIFLAGAAITLATVALVKAKDKPSVEPLKVVPSIDVNKYMGTWYEVARLPNRFESDCEKDVSATYSLRADGNINVLNQCRKKSGEMKKAEGIAKTIKGEPNSKLKVRFAPGWLSFLPFVWGDYWVMELSSDYKYAVIGEPRRKWLWILSRTPDIDESLYNDLIKRINQQGYDTSNIIRNKRG
jgi:apolipoprotein D and lipocalin family protein